jgi:hypothetical protein
MGDRLEASIASTATAGTCGSDPTSLVAAEIRLGFKASRHLRRLAGMLYSNHVPMQHFQ